jgi:hypothetical protein
MTRVRVTLHDTKGTPEDKRLAKASKWWFDAFGWKSEGVVPLADTPETPRALAERAVGVIQGDIGLDLWWVTETGSRLYCLERAVFLDEIKDRIAYWTEVVARLLERGGRLYRAGEMEIKG